MSFGAWLTLLAVGLHQEACSPSRHGCGPVAVWETGAMGVVRGVGEGTGVRVKVGVKVAVGVRTALAV